MSKKKKKKIDTNYLIMYIIIIFLLVVLGFFIYYTKVLKNANEADIILYSENENVTIDNSLPVSDKFGKTISDDITGGYKYITFDVVNVTSSAKKYQIYITKNKLDTNEIHNGYIKFYLTNENDNPIGIFEKNKVPSYVDLNYVKDKPESKLLYTGVLDKYQKEKFILKVWVAENYISESTNYFSFDIDAGAI